MSPSNQLPIPSVSVVIPTYNRRDYLLRALESVFAQTYRPLEVIVIDDGSSDDTVVMLEQLQRDPALNCELKMICQVHGGAAAARNLGIEHALGEYVAFLDDDDLWRPRFILELAGLLANKPTAALAFCGIAGIDERDSIFAQRENGLESSVPVGLLTRPFEQIVTRMPLQTSGVVARRSALRQAGGFDARLRVGEDWDLWYRLAKEFDFAYTQEVLACNRIHATNLPKQDIPALCSGLQMNLRHLPDVLEPDARRAMIARIQWQMTLLQERLMAEGAGTESYNNVLDTHLIPTTLRYTVGKTLLRWRLRRIGRAYAAILNSAGRLMRCLRRGMMHAV